MHETEHNYLGETLTVDLPDCVPIQATVAYQDDTDVNRFLLVCPPNPILGGDSQNNVVQAILAGAAKDGYLAVTFDYRGTIDGKVGDTDIMTYWEMLNESGDFSAIVADTIAVIQKVQNEFGARGCLAIVGYSFGSLIALQVAAQLDIPSVRCISPPLAEYDFTPWLQRMQPHLFLAPEDPFCPQHEIDKIRQMPGISITTVPSDDHFFRGTEQILAEQLLCSMKENLQ